MLFSTEPPDMPAPPHAPPAAGQVRWVGAPIRKHVTAMKALLRLQGHSFDGKTIFVSFLCTHWIQTKRVAEGSGHDSSDLDVRLALHSDNLMRDSLDYVKYIIGFWTQALRGLTAHRQR